MNVSMKPYLHIGYLIEAGNYIERQSVNGKQVLIWNTKRWLLLSGLC